MHLTERKTKRNEYRRCGELNKAMEFYHFKNVWTSDGKFYLRMDQENTSLWLIQI